VKYLIQKSKKKKKKSSFNTHATFEHSDPKEILPTATNMFNMLVIEDGFRKRLVEQTTAGMMTVIREEGVGFESNREAT